MSTSRSDDINITVCMIVKDEENVLEKSLKSIAKYDFDIIIVDTGSKDKTKEIASKYTDKIYDFKWCNDFSKARNFSLSKVKTEYALILDADEIIEKADIDSFNKLIIDNKNRVGNILIINKYTRNNEKYSFREHVNRFFKVSEYKYAGSIHEQIVSINNEKYSTYNIPVEVSHSGYEYDEIKRKDKLMRNITLLKEELKKGSDPYIYYQLGKSYYMKEDYSNAILNFANAMEFDLDTKLEYVQDMIESYGYALINSKQYDKALDILNLYDEFKVSCDFVFLCGLIYMNNGLFNEAVNEFKKAVKYNECKMEGVNDYLAFYNIGVIYECLGDAKNSYEYYKKAHKYHLAIEAINRLKVK